MPKSPLIAIVDDDRAFGESMIRLLRSLGYRADAFLSASEFLSSGHIAEIECLIADAHMPDMAGPELSRALADSGRSTPTILLTGDPDAELRVRALKGKVICILRKPVDADRFAQCLRSAIHSRPALEKEP
jgi:FixJ family two-component response regulator